MSKSQDKKKRKLLKEIAILEAKKAKIQEYILKLEASKAK
jgi:hypothetical protein